MAGALLVVGTAERGLVFGGGFDGVLRAAGKGDFDESMAMMCCITIRRGDVNFVSIVR